MYRLCYLFVIALSLAQGLPPPREEAARLLDHVTGEILTAFDRHLALEGDRHTQLLQKNQLLQQQLRSRAELITLAQVRLTQQRDLLQHQTEQIQTLSQQLQTAKSWAKLMASWLDRSSECRKCAPASAFQHCPGPSVCSLSEGLGSTT